MVGDDLNNDVLAAQVVGMTGVLVRTGKFRQDTFDRWAADEFAMQPNHVIDSVADLPGLLGVAMSKSMSRRGQSEQLRTAPPSPSFRPPRDQNQTKYFACGARGSHILHLKQASSTIYFIGATVKRHLTAPLKSWP